MTKRNRSHIAAVAVARRGLVAAACGGRQRRGRVGRAHSTELGEGEGALNIIAWAGYAEDGSTDPSVDWVNPFEDQTGCKTNVKIGNTRDEMVQLMRLVSTTACRHRATRHSA